MSKKNLQLVKRSTLPDYPVGQEVLLIRPHLWSGATGVVESVNGEGIHRLLVRGKDPKYPFHTDATADTMRAWMWGDLVKV